MKARRSVNNFEDIYEKRGEKSGGGSYELKTLKEGYLSKQGTISRRNWKSRIFRLTLLSLAYYEDDDDQDTTAYKGEFPIYEDGRVEDVQETPPGCPEGFLFRYISPKSSVNLSLLAETEEERGEWKDAILQACRLKSTVLYAPLLISYMEKEEGQEELLVSDALRLLRNKSEKKIGALLSRSLLSLHGEKDNLSIMSKVFTWKKGVHIELSEPTKRIFLFQFPSPDEKLTDENPQNNLFALSLNFGYHKDAFELWRGRLTTIVAGLGPPPTLSPPPPPPLPPSPPPTPSSRRVSFSVDSDAEEGNALQMAAKRRKTKVGGNMGLGVYVRRESTRRLYDDEEKDKDKESDDEADRKKGSSSSSQPAAMTKAMEPYPSDSSASSISKSSDASSSAASKSGSSSAPETVLPAPDPTPKTALPAHDPKPGSKTKNPSVSPKLTTSSPSAPKSTPSTSISASASVSATASAKPTAVTAVSKSADTDTASSSTASVAKTAGAARLTAKYLAAKKKQPVPKKDKEPEKVAGKVNEKGASATDEEKLANTASDGTSARASASHPQNASADSSAHAAISESNPVAASAAASAGADASAAAGVNALAMAAQRKSRRQSMQITSSPAPAAVPLETSISPPAAAAAAAAAGDAAALSSPTQTPALLSSKEEQAAANPTPTPAPAQSLALHLSATAATPVSAPVHDVEDLQQPQASKASSSDASRGLNTDADNDSHRPTPITVATLDTAPIATPMAIPDPIPTIARAPIPAVSTPSPELFSSATSEPQMLTTAPVFRHTAEDTSATHSELHAARVPMEETKKPGVPEQATQKEEEEEEEEVEVAYVESVSDDEPAPAASADRSTHTAPAEVPAGPPPAPFVPSTPSANSVEDPSQTTSSLLALFDHTHTHHRPLVALVFHLFAHEQSHTQALVLDASALQTCCYALGQYVSYDDARELVSTYASHTHNQEDCLCYEDFLVFWRSTQPFPSLRLSDPLFKRRVLIASRFRDVDVFMTGTIKETQFQPIYDLLVKDGVFVGKSTSKGSGTSMTKGGDKLYGELVKGSADRGGGSRIALSRLLVYVDTHLPPPPPPQKPTTLSKLWRRMSMGGSPLPVQPRAPTPTPTSPQQALRSPSPLPPRASSYGGGTTVRNSSPSPGASQSQAAFNMAPATVPNNSSSSASARASASSGSSHPALPAPSASAAAAKASAPDTHIPAVSTSASAPRNTGAGATHTTIAGTTPSNASNAGNAAASSNAGSTSISNSSNNAAARPAPATTPSSTSISAAAGPATPSAPDASSPSSPASARSKLLLLRRVRSTSSKVDQHLSQQSSHGKHNDSNGSGASADKDGGALITPKWAPTKAAATASTATPPPATPFAQTHAADTSSATSAPPTTPAAATEKEKEKEKEKQEREPQSVASGGFVNPLRGRSSGSRSAAAAAPATTPAPVKTTASAATATIIATTSSSVGTAAQTPAKQPEERVVGAPRRDARQPELVIAVDSPRIPHSTTINTHTPPPNLPSTPFTTHHHNNNEKGYPQLGEKEEEEEEEEGSPEDSDAESDVLTVCSGFTPISPLAHTARKSLTPSLLHAHSSLSNASLLHEELFSPPPAPPALGVAELLESVRLRALPRLVSEVLSADLATAQQKIRQLLGGDAEGLGEVFADMRSQLPITPPATSVPASPASPDTSNRIISYEHLLALRAEVEETVVELHTHTVPRLLAQVHGHLRASATSVCDEGACSMERCAEEVQRLDILKNAFLREKRDSAQEILALELEVRRREQELRKLVSRGSGVLFSVASRLAWAQKGAEAGMGEWVRDMDRSGFGAGVCQEWVEDGGNMLTDVDTSSYSYAQGLGHLPFSLSAQSDAFLQQVDLSAYGDV